MNTYELRLAGVENEARLAAARWALFVCPEVRDLRATNAPDRVTVVYEGVQPDVARWVAVLIEAGYPASPLEQAGTPPAAA